MALYNESNDLENFSYRADVIPAVAGIQQVIGVRLYREKMFFDHRDHRGQTLKTLVIKLMTEKEGKMSFPRKREFRERNGDIC